MKKIRKITSTSLLVILLLFLTYVGIHQILTRNELKQNPAIGQYVTVNGKNMNLCIMGNQGKKIVLLPGLGTAAPVLDFMPLATELAKNNTVIIIEPFGYGWSDITPEERTIEKEVSEIRCALQEADISGPYILMPHSITGLHSIYYANTYPDEVAGIIGIDCSLPKMVEYFGEEYPQKMPLWIGNLSKLGIMRLLTLVSPESFLSDNAKGFYSDENLTLQKHIAAWKSNNSNVIDEMNHIEDSITKTYHMTFSKKMPVLLFARDDSDMPLREDGKTNLSLKESYITNPKLQKAVLLQGPHYLHWTAKDEILIHINEFLNQFE